jgi:hypothetical protein
MAAPINIISPRDRFAMFRRPVISIARCNAEDGDAAIVNAFRGTKSYNRFP